MKKGYLYLLITILTILLVVPLILADTTATTTSVKATLVSQSPDPVEPGQVVTVKFKIENEGKQTKENVIVELQPSFPFTFYGDKAEKNIGKLRASISGADVTYVEYKLKVDDLAAEGDAELELQVKIGTSSVSYVDDDFLIDIQTHDAVVDITSITTDPQQIAPGETSDVTINVKNLADSLLKDIRLKLDFSSPTLPLAPYQSSSERILAKLPTNYQNSLRFQIIAAPDATPGLYKIPLNITYNDEKGNSNLIEDILAITIGDTPKLKGHIKKSTSQKAGSPSTITLEIANAGTTDVKFVELNILPSDDYQLITPSRYFYIGDIDADDTESEELSVYINKKVETLHIPIKLSYIDANNRPFQQPLDLEMDLYTSSQLKKFGVTKSNGFWIYVIIILAAIGGYIYYKKYYKKKKKK